MKSLLDRQDDHWERGEYIRVEELVGGEVSELEDAEVLIDLIVNEKDWRESLSPAQRFECFAQEYRARFPQFAHAIDEQFKFVRFVTRLPDIDDPPGEFLGKSDGILEDLEPGFPDVAGYRIIAEHARGTFGIVYKAEELEFDPPRLVALKMLRDPGLSPLNAIAMRIEAGRVASLDHNNIIKIYSVGEHEALPYFSMPFLAKGSLESRLNDFKARPFHAIRFMIMIAKAVHRAHEAFILHCDLKPSNILIDDDDQPKVTDFGLAINVFSRECGPSVGEGASAEIGDGGSLRLSSLLLGGTPEYMAPEQWRGDRGALSVRTDVYGLGAILYHLLYSRPPGGKQGWYQPVLPSESAPEITTDVEAICMKCLAEDPADRYKDVNELIADLNHCLDGRPVEARPLVGVYGRWVRFSKWVRRNPYLAALLAVVVTSILGFFINQWRNNIRLSIELAATEHARDFAANATFKLAKLNAERASPSDAILDYMQAVGIYDELHRSTPDNPWYSLGKARALNNLALLAADKGRRDLAEAMLVEARTSLNALSMRLDVPPETPIELANTLANLGNLFTRADRFDEAIECYREVRAIRAELAISSPFDVDVQVLFVKSDINFGHLYENMIGQREKAVRYYEDAIDRLLPLVELRPDHAEANDTLHVATTQVGILYHDLGRLEDAVRILVDVVKRTGSILKKNSKVNRIRYINAAALTNLGNSLADQGHYDEAEKKFMQSIESLRILTIASPDSLQFRHGLAAALSSLGSCFQKTNKLEPCRKVLVEAVALLNDLNADDPLNPVYLHSLSVAESSLGCLEFQRGVFEAGRGCFNRSLAALDRLKRSNLDARISALSTLNNLARLELDTDHLGPAKDAVERGQREGSALAVQNPKNSNVRVVLARLFDVKGLLELKLGSPDKVFTPENPRLEPALTAFSEAVRFHNEAKILGRLAAEDEAFVGEPHAHAAVILQLLGSFDDALSHWDAATKSVEPSNPREELYRVSRLMTVARAGRHSEAAQSANQMRSQTIRHPDSRYNLACVYSVAFGAAGADLSLPEPRRSEMRKAYLSAALSVLEEGRQKGDFRNDKVRDSLENDPDFAPIRGQEPFKSFLNALHHDRSTLPFTPR